MALSHRPKPSNLDGYLSQSPNSERSSWALVTGATDGIGLGLAKELLSHGFNVFIHGRNQEKLHRVQSELQSTHPDRSIRILCADAAAFTQDDIKRLVAEIKEVKAATLRVLINNVGGTGVLPANFQTFESHTAEQIALMLNLNVLFSVQLTHALIPLLKSQKEPTLIMNIGSQASIGIPYLPVYSGTKAFIHAWSRSLGSEFATFGENQPIEVVEILVGSVQTQQNQTAKPTLFVPDAQTFAKAALGKVGCGRRDGVAAYWPHALQQWVWQLLPSWIVDRVMVMALKGVAGKTERVW